MPDLPLLPFLDPDRLTWREREQSAQEANRLFAMGKLIPIGALACDDKRRLWGFYVEQPRARYVYIYDFEIPANGEQIQPIGELYRVPRIRFTPPPGFDPCDAYFELYGEEKPIF